jgi:hypothetical protein
VDRRVRRARDPAAARRMFGAPPRDDGGEAYLMLFVDGTGST